MRAFFGHTDAGPLVALADAERLCVVQGGAEDEPLALFDRALAEASIARAGINEIAVDCGPDGFSSVRRRVAAAAALAFALDAAACATGPLTPAEAAALPSAGFAKAAPLAPRYSRPPNITVSKKAGLLRR